MQQFTQFKKTCKITINNFFSELIGVDMKLGGKNNLKKSPTKDHHHYILEKSIFLANLRGRI